MGTLIIYLTDFSRAKVKSVNCSFCLMLFSVQFTFEFRDGNLRYREFKTRFVIKVWSKVCIKLIKIFAFSKLIAFFLPHLCQTAQINSFRFGKVKWRKMELNIFCRLFLNFSFRDCQRTQEKNLKNTNKKVKLWRAQIKQLFGSMRLETMNGSNIYNFYGRFHIGQHHARWIGDDRKKILIISIIMKLVSTSRVDVKCEENKLRKCEGGIEGFWGIERVLVV